MEENLMTAEKMEKKERKMSNQSKLVGKIAPVLIHSYSHMHICILYIHTYIQHFIIKHCLVLGFGSFLFFSFQIPARKTKKCNINFPSIHQCFFLSHLELF